MKFLFLSACILIALSGNAQMIIAHRGASVDAPENTMASVNLAWQKGAKAVEVDVHLSKDKRIMVIHDADTKRTCDQELVVAETSSEKLRELNAGILKGQRYSREKIPFLEDIIESIPKRRYLFVEIKSGPEVLPILKETLDNSRRKKRVIIISFDFETVAKAKELMPDVPAYWLHYTLLGVYSTKHLKKVKEANLDGISFRHKGLSKRYIAKAHAMGLKVFAWTVDSPKKAKKLKDMGVDGITTNRPEWLREQMEKY